MRDGTEEIEVGTLVGLWRYPVKSMAGEALSAVEVGWHGLAGDRRWAFIRPGLERSGFPWLTLRQNAAMGELVPSFEDPSDPEESNLLVSAPDGRRYDVVDPALAELLGPGVHVLKREAGLFDSMPLSLITTATLRALGAMSDRGELEPQRFRPNLLVAPHGDAEFPEDGWVGRTLRIGELRLRLDEHDPRCVIVTMDPQTGERDPNVLRQIARRRQGCAGVYGSVVARGRVAVGDAVILEAGSG